MDFRVLFAATVLRTTLNLRPANSLIAAALLFIVTTPACSQQRRVVVDQAGLYAAFIDVSVSHIQLANSITVNASRGSGSWPVLLGRDCLVDASPGIAYPRLDLNFAPNDRVQLGPGVTLTFRGLVLSNVFSRSQLSLDFFAQSPASSSIVWEGVVDRRSICQPLQEIRDTWANASRPLANANASGQQQAIVEGPNCNGDQGCYSMPVLRSYDVVVDSPAGYRLRLNNTLTVCDEFISQACIQAYGSDICYLNSMEELMARLNGGGVQPAGAATAPSGAGGLGSGAKAGVVAGCVVGGVAMLLVLLGVVLVCHRRRRRRLRAEQYAAAAAAGGSGGGGAIAFSVLDPTSPAGLAAFGSSRSGDTAPSNPIQQTHPHHQQHINLAKLLPGGGGKAAAVAALRNGRPSHDTSLSTDVRPSPGRAALESHGSGGSYRAGSMAPSGGGGGGALRPSGSGVGEMAPTLTSSTATATAATHPALPQQSLSHPPSHPASTVQPHSEQHGSGSQVVSGGGGGSTTHSLGSAVMLKLRSFLSRAGSRKHLHNDRPAPPPSLPPAAMAAGLAAQGSAGGSAHTAATLNSGALSGRAAAAAVAAGGSNPGGGGGGATGRRAPILISGTLGSARDSSGGQLLMTTGSGRPSIGEIVEELERMEGHWAREQAKAGSGGGGKGAKRSSSAAARGKSPAGAGAAAAVTAAAGGRPSSDQQPQAGNARELQSPQRR